MSDGDGNDDADADAAGVSFTSADGNGADGLLIAASASGKAATTGGGSATDGGGATTGDGAGRAGGERKRGRTKVGWKLGESHAIVTLHDLNTLAQCETRVLRGLAMPFEARAPGHVDALRAATAQRLHPHDKTHGTTNDDTNRRAAARDRQ